MAEEKEAFYFSHDSNARNDDKVVLMRMKHGWEGYGLFWAILEKLRDSSNYTCVKDYAVISFDLRTDAGKIKSIIEDFGLFEFTEDGKGIYSESLNRRMAKRKEKSEKARESANQRWVKEGKKPKENTNTMRTHSERITNAMLIKEKKGKENKEKEIKGEDEGEPPSVDSFSSISVEELARDCLKDQVYFVEHVCRQHGLEPGKLPPLLEEFNRHLRSLGEEKKQKRDYRIHFQNWLRKQPQPKLKPKMKQI